MYRNGCKKVWSVCSEVTERIATIQVVPRNFILWFDDLSCLCITWSQKCLVSFFHPICIRQPILRMAWRWDPNVYGSNASVKKPIGRDLVEIYIKSTSSMDTNTMVQIPSWQMEITSEIFYKVVQSIVISFPLPSVSWYGRDERGPTSSLSTMSNWIFCEMNTCSIPNW